MVLVPGGRSSAGLFEQRLVEVKAHRRYAHQRRRHARKTLVPHELSNRGVFPVQVLDLQESLPIGVPGLQRKHTPGRLSDEFFDGRPPAFDLGPRQQASKSQMASALVLDDTAVVNGTAIINGTALVHTVPHCSFQQTCSCNFARSSLSWPAFGPGKRLGR